MLQIPKGAWFWRWLNPIGVGPSIYRFPRVADAAPLGWRAEPLCGSTRPTVHIELKRYFGDLLDSPILKN